MLTDSLPKFAWPALISVSTEPLRTFAEEMYLSSRSW